MLKLEYTDLTYGSLVAREFGSRQKSRSSRRRIHNRKRLQTSQFFVSSEVANLRQRRLTGIHSSWSSAFQIVQKL